MSLKSSITPRPPSAHFNKIPTQKPKVEPKLIPEYFSDHFGSSRRPRSTSAGTRRAPGMVWKLMVKNNPNKENHPPVYKSLSKPPVLPKPTFAPIPEIKNTFYEQLAKLEPQLDHVHENIELPIGFFSPIKSRARTPFSIVN